MSSIFVFQSTIAIFWRCYLCFSTHWRIHCFQRLLRTSERVATKCGAIKTHHSRVWAHYIFVGRTKHHRKKLSHLLLEIRLDLNFKWCLSPCDDPFVSFSFEVLSKTLELVGTTSSSQRTWYTGIETLIERGIVDKAFYRRTGNFRCLSLLHHLNDRL